MSEAVILIGHGGTPSDIPREKVARLKSLEGQRLREGGPMTTEESALDAEVRNWPRTPETDPYKFGLEQVAAALRERIGDVRLDVAYNEFCAPSIPDQVDALVREGITRIRLITTMFTPGGSHSEAEIPAIVEQLRQAHPDVELHYVWPFNLEAVGQFLADHLEQSRGRG